MGAVHHSTIYRQQECPSYRIIDSRLMRLLPLLQRIAAEEKRPLVIAIDGRAASGKTIAAEQLRFILGGSAIHMDDFFLPVSLRTAERFAEPGGNVHYERFCEEVLPKLARGEHFAYRMFNYGKAGVSMATERFRRCRIISSKAHTAAIRCLEITRISKRFLILGMMNR